MSDGAPAPRELDDIAANYQEAEAALVRIIARHLAGELDSDLPAPAWTDRKLVAVRALRASAQAVIAGLSTASAGAVRDAAAQAFRAGWRSALPSCPPNGSPHPGSATPPAPRRRGALPGAHHRRAVSPREELSLDTPPAKMRDTVPAGRVTRARELATIRFHWHWLLGQDWLPDFAGDLRDVVHQLRAGTRELARSIRVGTCPTVVEMLEPDDPDAEPIPVVCGTSLRLKLGDDVIRCGGCRTSWPRRRWHLLGDG